MSRSILVLIFCVSGFYNLLASPVLGQNSVTVTLDPNTRFQTITGWEAVDQSGQDACPGFNTYKNALFDEVVNDLGINRLRVEIKTISLAQDNSPNSLKFNITSLDDRMNRVILPIKTRLQNRGETLYFNGEFVGDSSFPIQTDMSLYAAEVLKLYQHMSNTYGFTPTSWEIALEPGYVSPKWTPAKITDAIKKTSALLRANRATFTNDPNWTPSFTAPSSACGPGTALGHFSQMLSANNNQLPPDMKEFAYHRYCAPTGTELQSVANLRTQHNINVSQLEHGGADHNELHADLKISRVSAWEQFTIAFCTADDGYQYYLVNGDTYSIASRTKFLRQYFKYVRRDAVRIGATIPGCDNNTLCMGSIDPLAFINQDGRYVIIVKTTAAGPFTLANIANGTYGIKYTTGTEYDKNLTDQTITNGQLSTSIPGAGVITVYGKSPGGSSPTPEPTLTTSEGCSRAADIDCNNTVNIFDLSRLLAVFGQAVTSREDINSDGTVTIFDLSLLLSNFGL